MGPAAEPPCYGRRQHAVTGDPQRANVLNSRLNYYVLTTSDSRWQDLDNAQVQERIEMLRDIMLIADEAMETEGVALRVRNRVAHWIIYGEAPEAPRPDDSVPHLGWMCPGDTIDLTRLGEGFHTRTWTE